MLLLLRRCWLYLAKELGEVLTSVPEGFQEHIIWAFSKRAKQQDMVLCRLALFLDPRFRQAALSSSSSATTMSQFISTAAKYGHSQGWDAAKINTLLMQLSHYSDCIPPFDLAYTGPGFNCRSWWSTVGKDEQVLSSLSWPECCWMWCLMQLGLRGCSVRWAGLRVATAAS
jgi:hypothetical protein